MRALPPNDAISAATFFSSFSLRASKRSSPAPASAISLAIAAPMPLDAPVTRTVLPLISMRVLLRSFFDSNFLKRFLVAFQPVVLDHHVFALDVAGFVEALVETGDPTCGAFGRPLSDKPDLRHRRLLRPRGQRPCNYSA